VADIARAARILEGRARPGVMLGPYTTYRVGGPAALFVEAHSLEDLRVAGEAVAECALPVLVVGRGSNMLVADAGFPGLAVHLGEEFATWTVTRTEHGGSAWAGGALPLPVLARQTAGAGLTGLEWAVGVPGSVGGAVRMNAGGHGSEIAATLSHANVFDVAAAAAEELVLDAAALEFAYRHSSITATQIVTGATFELHAGNRAESEATIAEIVRWRRENQPGGANAGSVFTNPPGDSAGRIIDAAGLKGLRVGSAFVSPKHANFFQADDGGSADDVRRLIAEVQRLVEERSGVRLVPELRLVGEQV
jgi:UDP-N-acetylmuramate dehydrogenase